MTSETIGEFLLECLVLKMVMREAERLSHPSFMKYVMSATEQPEGKVFDAITRLLLDGEIETFEALGYTWIRKAKR